MIFSKKKPIKVYLDFDNTLVDSNSAMIYLLNQEYGTNKSYEELKKYDFKDLFPLWGNGFYDGYREDENKGKSLSLKKR